MGLLKQNEGDVHVYNMQFPEQRKQTVEGDVQTGTSLGPGFVYGPNYAHKYHSSIGYLVRPEAYEWASLYWFGPLTSFGSLQRRIHHQYRMNLPDIVAHTLFKEGDGFNDLFAGL